MNIKDRIIKAEKLGIKGYKNGKKAAAQDKKLLKLLEDVSSHNTKMNILKAWSKGWTMEHKKQTDKELKKLGVI